MDESKLSLITIYSAVGEPEGLIQFLEKVPTQAGFTYLVYLDGLEKDGAEYSIFLKINQATSMKVWKAASGMAVRPNHLYILSPASPLTIDGGILVPAESVLSEQEHASSEASVTQAVPFMVVVPATGQNRIGAALEQVRQAGGKVLLIDAHRHPAGADGYTIWTPDEAVREIARQVEQEIPDVPASNGTDTFLKQQRQFIDEIANTTPDIIYLLDLQKKSIIYINQRAADILGQPSAEHFYKLKSRVFREILHPDDFLRRMEHINACTYLKTNEIKEIEVRLKVADGSWRWFKVRDRAFLRAEDGTVLQTIGIVQDIQERKEALDKLREEHLRFRNAEALGNIGSFERILPGSTLVCSDEFYRIHGLEPQSQVFDMDKLLSFVHPEDQKGMREQLWATHTHESPLDLFQRIIRPDGAVRIVHVRADIVKNERGKPVKLFGTIQDFTELRQAQEEAEKNKSLMEAVFNGSLSEMMVLLAVRNDRGEIIDFEYRLLNHIAHTMAGQNLVGKRYLELNPQDRASGLFDLYRRVVETGESADLERFYIGSGFRNWFRITAVKLDDGVVLTVEDITKRKLAEEENQQATRLLRDIFEGIQVQISYLKPLYDGQGNLEDFLIILTNDEDLRQQGQKKIQSLSRRFSDVFPGYRQHELWDMLAETYQTGRSKRFETWYGLDGLDLWIDVSIVKHESGLIYSCQIINDRKKAEEALTKTLSVFHRAEEVGSMGSYEADLATMTFHFSDNLFRLFGEEPSAFVPTLDYIDARSHPDDIPVVRSVLEEAILNRQPYTYTRRIYLPDGQLRTLHAQGVVVTDTDERPVKLLGIIQDVTERLKTEETIRQMLSGSMAAIVLLESVRDEQGQIIDFLYKGANQAAQDITGIPAEEMVGKRLRDLSPTTPDSFFDAYTEVVETGRMVRLELYHPQSESDTGTWFDTTAVKNGDGLILTLLNVSEQKRAEQAVRQSHELLQATMDSSMDMIQVFEAVRDDAGKIVDFTWIFTNLTWNKHYGDVIGKSLLQQNPDVIETGLFDKFVQVTETGVTIDHEQYYSHEQFHEQWFHQTLVKMGDGLVMNTEDITARKKSEAEILRLKDEVAQKATDKYYSIFNSIDEGFSILELILDDNGKPIDFIYKETNPAFVKHAGLDLRGKRRSELFLDKKDFLLEKYEHLAKTGEPLHFEYSVQIGGEQWFQVTAARIGGEGSKHLGVIFRNITERKHHELKQQYLLTLNDTVRSESDPVAIEEKITAVAMEYFGADRCYYCTVEEQDAIIRRDATKEGFPSVAGSYPLSSFALLKKVLDEGVPFVVYDAQTSEILDEPLRELCLRLQVISFIDVPIIKNGKAAGVLCLVQSTPRQWTQSDIDLAVETAERTWTAVERAKVEEALHLSEARHRTLFDSVDEGVCLFERMPLRPDGLRDYRYIAMNPAMQEMFGIPDLTGQSMRDNFPDEVEDWYDDYDRVLETGQSVRFERGSVPQGMVLEMFVTRVEDGFERRLMAVMRNVTERKQRDQQQAFLLRLSDMLRTEPNADAVIRRVLEMLSEQLRLDLCYVGVYRLDDDWVEFPYQISNDRVPALPEGIRLSNFPTALQIAFDRTLAIDDVTKTKGLSRKDKQSIAGLGLMAVVAATIRRGENNPLWSIGAGSATHRNWTPAEVKLVEEVTERTWAALERVKAEEALRQSEEQFRLFVTASSDLVYKMSPDWSQMYSLNGKNVLADTLDPSDTWLPRYVMEEDQPQVLATIQEAIRTKKMFELEHRVIRQDGTVGWALSRAVPVLDEQGEIIQWIGAVRDVTLRKTAELQLQAFNALLEQQVAERTSALKQSKDRLEAVINVSPMVLSVLKSVRNDQDEIIDFHVDWVSKSGEQLVGKDVTGLRLLEQFPYLRKYGIVEEFIRTIEVGSSTDYEYLYDEGGYSIWVRWKAVKLGDGLFAAVEDITERKREGLLVEEQAHFIRSVTETMPDMISVMEYPSRTLKFTNREPYTMQGFDIEDMRRLSAEELKTLMHPDDLQATNEYFDSFATLPDDQTASYEYRARTKSGEWHWFRVRGRVFERDEEGRVKAILNVVQNINEQKRASDEIRKSHEQIQAMFEAIPLHLTYNKAVKGDQDKIVDFTMEIINQVNLERTGLTQDDLGKPLTEIRPGLEKLPLWESMLRVAETGESVTDETFYDAHGYKGWILASVVPFMEGVLVAALNIDDRIKAEKERIKQFTILNQSEEVAQMGSWEYDVAHDILTWSEGMYHLYEMELGTPVSLESYDQLVIDADRQKMSTICQRLRMGEVVADETIRIRVGNDQKYIKLKSDALATENGRVVSILGIDLDVTESVEAELQLRQLTNNLQIVLESSPAYIGYFKAVRDNQDQVVDFQLAVCNQRLAGYLKRSTDQLIGTSQHERSEYLWEERTFEVLHEVLITDNHIYEERHSIRNGEDYWLGISVMKQDDGVVVTGLNVTKLRQAEQQEKYWMQELERSNETLSALEEMRQYIRMRGEILRTASHDLRGSFGVIVGATSLLEMMNTEEERTQTLDMLHRSLKQVSHMMNQLLDFSRLESGQEELHVAPFDAAELLMELSESVRPLAQDKKLWIKDEGPKQLLVEGDSVKVRRIAQNLLLNAIKYTSKGGVRISWALEGEEGSHWQLVVEDTGPGLSPPLIQQITGIPSAGAPDNGWKAPEEQEGSMSHYGRRPSGEGIGLTIVKRLCELMGAELEIESTPKVGTVFRIRFPMRYTD